MTEVSGYPSIEKGNNWSVVVFDTAARTASANSADQENTNGRGVRLFLHVHADGGTTPTFTFDVVANFLK